MDVLKARFKSNSFKDLIQRKMKEIIQSRKISQPKAKNKGSTFMNGKISKLGNLLIILVVED